MKRIVLLLLAALLALMPVTSAYAGGGDDNRNRDVDDIGINLEDLEDEDVDVNFDFRPFRVPKAEIEIAPGVEIEVPFFTGLGFLLRRQLLGLGLLRNLALIRGLRLGVNPFLD